MLLSGLALALIALAGQETAQPATPQAQFDAWFKALPAENPRPLKQRYAWRITMVPDAEALQDATGTASFMPDIRCEGEIICAMTADPRRFRIDLSAQAHVDDGDKEILDFEGVLGLAADGKKLKVYFDVEEGTEQAAERGGAEVPLEDVERLFDLFRDSIPAIMAMAEAPGHLGDSVVELWSAMPGLTELMHPRGYALSMMRTTPVSGFRREGNRVVVDLAPDRDMLRAGLEMDPATVDPEELPIEVLMQAFEGMRLSVAADAATGQPLGGLMQLDFPFSALEPGAAGHIRTRIEITSASLSDEEPSAAELAAPEGIEWIDGKPFIELALMGLKQMLDEAASSEDEEF